LLNRAGRENLYLRNPAFGSAERQNLFKIHPMPPPAAAARD
jgi:hypothetical protein